MFRITYNLQGGWSVCTPNGSLLAGEAEGVVRAAGHYESFVTPATVTDVHQAAEMAQQEALA